MEIKLINVRSLLGKRMLFLIMRTFIFLLCTTVFSFNTERAAIYRLLVPQVVGDDDLTSQLMMATNHLSDSYRYLRAEIFDYLAKGKIVTDNTLSKSAVLNLLDILWNMTLIQENQLA